MVGFDAGERQHAVEDAVRHPEAEPVEVERTRLARREACRARRGRAGAADGVRPRSSRRLGCRGRSSRPGPLLARAGAGRDRSLLMRRRRPPRGRTQGRAHVSVVSVTMVARSPSASRRAAMSREVGFGRRSPRCSSARCRYGTLDQSHLHAGGPRVPSDVVGSAQSVSLPESRRASRDRAPRA